jgi:putative ABC transport system permease protein
VEHRWIYGDYLDALNIPVVKGRALDSRDGQHTATVLINQAMADKFWPGEDPIGKRFGQGDDLKTYFTVAGVIGNIRSFGLTQNTPYEFYESLDQSAFRSMTVVLRSSGAAPASLIPSARAIVSALDPNLPVNSVQTMEEVVAASVGQPRLLSALSGLFGALAGLLAMVGVYGVTSYNVRRQRREHAIRLALGADPGAVRGLIVRRGAAIAGAGIGIGLAGSLLLTRVLESMLNDVKPTDPAVFLGNAAIVLAVSMAACYLPARWAGRVDPAVALRNE